MRFIFAGLICLFSLRAQETGSYSISGVVVNSQTGEPVKYALVTLRSFRPFDPSTPQPAKPQSPVQKSAQAGSAGEFQFTALSRAHYTITAQKPGFTPPFSPQEPGSRQIDLADSVTGLELKLAPLGVIEGKVLDQNDEPLRGVNIVALQVLINDGLRSTTTPRSVATDDRGAYRLWNLPPGRYYIKAAGKSGGTYRYVADATPYYSSWQSFAPAYFGGGQTLDSATPIQIEEGSKTTADFRLNLQPAFKIRGVLVNPPTGTITFDLLQGTEDVSASRTSLNGSTGRFEVQDVTPGTYLLRATQEEKMRGETIITVNGSDVNDVSIALSPPVTVQGTVRVIGAPLKVGQMPGFKEARAAMDVDGADLDRVSDEVMQTSCGVSLHQRGGGAKTQSTPARNGNATGNIENGTFTIAGVLPGLYTVRVECFGGYPTSVLAGGVDLLTNPSLLIQPGAAPAPIDIQVKPGGGTLAGEIQVSSPLKNPGVLLVPAFSNSTGPVMIPVGFVRQSKDKIQFMHPFLAPGDYTAYAFSDCPQIEFRNPSFLQTLTGGVAARIEDGQHLLITIQKVVQ